MSGGDVAVGLGLIATATGIALIYFPAALIATGIACVVLGVTPERRR